MVRNRPHRVHSSQLGVIVYPPQGGTEKSNLLLRVLTSARSFNFRARQIDLKECRPSLPASFRRLFCVTNF